MNTPNQTFRNAPRQASNTAKTIGEEVSDFADDVTRRAGKQYTRARDMAVDAYDEVHDASVRNPHLTLAIALGLGFLFGIVAASRR